LTEAEQKYEASKELFQKSNDSLTQEMSELWDSRYNDFEDTYTLLVTSHYVLYQTISKSYHTLSSTIGIAPTTTKSNTTPPATTTNNNISTNTNTSVDLLSGPTTTSTTTTKQTTTKKSTKRKALYDYSAQEENELTFKEGDLINLVEVYEDSDWWKGELNGKIGIFPSNFTEELGEPEAAKLQNISQKSTTISPNTQFSNIGKRRALFNYKATESTELTFKEGDIINIIEKPGDSDWWRGELNGNLGLFPSNYTQELK